MFGNRPSSNIERGIVSLCVTIEQSTVTHSLFLEKPTDYTKPIRIGLKFIHTCLYKYMSDNCLVVQ